MIEKRIRLLLLLAAGVLCALSINTLLMTSSRLLWMLAVLVSENGHWLAFACLALGGVAYRHRCHRSGGGRLTFAFLAVSFVLFARPPVLATTMEDDWRREFDLEFGTSSGDPWFEWAKIVAIDLRKPEFERRTFKARDGVDVTYDFFRSSSKDASPLVVVVHGGGWDSGNSEQLPALSMTMARAGYAVASIDYRLAPGSKWPTQRFDVEDAIADIRANATSLGVAASDGVYLLGRSAGGQIAGALAYLNPPFCVKGFVNFYAPSDLTFGYEISEENHWLLPRKLIRQLMGEEPLKAKDVYQTASLTENVSASAAPTLLLHGRPDSLTWYKHSERLQSRLKLAGVKAYFLDLPWGHHGFDFFTAGPGGQVSSNAVLAFLESQKSRCR